MTWRERLAAATAAASETNAGAPPWFAAEDSEGAPFPQEAQDVIWRLTEAIRLTQEYIGLPAVPGWSWYDALVQYRPDLDFEPSAPWRPR